MPIREWLFEVPDKEKKEEKQPQSFIDISLMKLSELAKRDIAIEIYSEILGCHIWLCSNEGMVAQVKQDDPGAVCYTASEMIQLIRLNPILEDLRRIHEAKRAFPGSKIVDSQLQDDLPEVLK